MAFRASFRPRIKTSRRGFSRPKVASTRSFSQHERTGIDMNKIQKAVDEYNQRIDKTSIIIEADGSVTTRWEKYGVQLRIAQAACNYGDYIVTGTRHYCPIMSLQIDAIGHDKLKEFAGGLDNVQQGFTTQYGVFVDRKEGYKIALAAGQLLPRHEYGETLYSESYV